MNSGKKSESPPNTLNHVFEESPLGIAVINHETIELTNKKFNKYFARNHEELIGKSVKEIFTSANDLNNFQNQDSFQTTVLLHNQTSVFLHISVVPFHGNDGDIRTLVYTSELKRESNTAISFQDHSAAINLIPSIILVLDENTNVLNLNDTALQITGILREDALGIQPGNVLKCIRSYDSPEGCGKGPHCSSCKIRTTVLETILTGKNHFKIETPFTIKKEDKLIHFTVLISSIEITYSNARAILVVLDDITEEKRISGNLDQSKQELARKNSELNSLNSKLIDSYNRIKKINSQLLIAKEKAEKSDRLKSSFLNNISHEIRTPLNGIVGFSEIITNPELDKESIFKYAKTINQSSQQLLTIISDIMDISMIESGQAALYKSELNLNSMLESIYDVFKQKAGVKNIDFNYKAGLPDEQSLIKTDRVKLRQILCNLIDNAIKFTETGRVEFGYFINKEELEFFVSDTGHGIAPEHQQKIYKIFQQATPDIHIQYGGNGLGLSISKAWINLMGGKIWLNSSPGKGSKFSFAFPLTNGEMELLPNKSQAFISKQWEKYLSGKTILIAEDDLNSFEYLHTLLKRVGVKTIWAMDGALAIELIKDGLKPDLILMDLKLPVLDGIAATRQIKSVLPEIPVIAQTACCLNRESQAAREAGCVALITKPYSRTELIQVIAKHL